MFFLEELNRTLDVPSHATITKVLLEDLLRDQFTGRYCSVAKKLTVAVVDVQRWTRGVVNPTGSVSTSVDFTALMIRPTNDIVAQAVITSVSVEPMGLKKLIKIRASAPPVDVLIQEELGMDQVVPEKGSIVTFRSFYYKVAEKEGRNGSDRIVINATRVPLE